MSIQHKPKDYPYSSELAKLIECFIAEKRVAGYKYETEAKMLYRFDRFLSDEAFSEFPLRRDLIEKYTARTPYEAKRNHYSRYCLIRQLCKFALRTGHDTYVPPPPCNARPHDGFVPYIFSQDEIRRFLNTADSMSPCEKCPQRHIVFPMILRLLYCCGLRVSEALNLTLDNVDLDAGILRILDSKNNKHRLVPMSASLTAYTRAYTKVIHIHSEGSSAFLPTSRQKAWSLRTANANFHNVLFAAGIPYGGPGVGPRVHDLRHTFAVHCLKAWVAAGADIRSALPYLSAYMGHVNIYSTQTYLRLTPELFPLITQSVKNACETVIPEFGGAIDGFC